MSWLQKPGDKNNSIIFLFLFAFYSLHFEGFVFQHRGYEFTLKIQWKCNLFFFPVCSSYKITTDALKVVLLASKSWDNLERQASSALQEGGWLLSRDKKGGILGKTGRVWEKEAYWAKLATLQWQGLWGMTRVEEGHELPWPSHSCLLWLWNKRDQPTVSQNSKQRNTWHLHSNIFKHD